MPASKRLEYGGHALVWAGDWTPAGARQAISGAARAGYDYIEIALLDPWKVDIGLTKNLLQEYGLRAHASLGLSPTTDVTSTNPAIVAQGDALLRQATDVLAGLAGLNSAASSTVRSANMRGRPLFKIAPTPWRRCNASRTMPPREASILISKS